MNIAQFISPRFPAVNTVEILFKKYVQAQRRYGLKVGDRVRVICKTTGYHELGWHNSWEREMDACVGRNFTVEEVNDQGIVLENSSPTLLGFSFGFPFFVLQKIDTKPIRIPMKNGGVTIVTKGHTYIDGRPFTKKTLKRIARAVIRMERNMAWTATDKT